MGDFSQDPAKRLKEAVSKNYVGVRMQQGVPILDSDWNLMEDLHKSGTAELFRHFIGSGVPSGSNGFEIRALAGGGDGTIVLKTITRAATYSSLAIDLAGSSAAGILGFSGKNFFHERYGSSSACLTGDSTEPFPLEPDMTLVLKNHLEQEVTITFSGNLFTGEDISRASAARIIEIINTACEESNVAIKAEKGGGNDFIIGGGNISRQISGIILAEGCAAVNVTDSIFTSQPLYKNDKLAEMWNVDIIEELTIPQNTEREDWVYLDIWEREVCTAEDNSLFNQSIGLETAIRLKREWAVRVIENAQDLSGITKLTGHHYTPLAKIIRKSSESRRITDDRIYDLRKKQLTLSSFITSPIHIKGEAGLEKVNPELFKYLMTSTSKAYKKLLDSELFLGGQFSDAGGTNSIKLFRVFQDVRFIAESAVTQITLSRLDNTGALNFLNRLYFAQKDFEETVRLLKGLPRPEEDTEALDAGCRELFYFLNSLHNGLEGNGVDIGGLGKNVLASQSPDLGRAYDAQAYIIDIINWNIGIYAAGNINIYFEGYTPAEDIIPPNTYEFTYKIVSELTIPDTIQLEISDTNELFHFVFTDPGPAAPGPANKQIFDLDADEERIIKFNMSMPYSTEAGASSRLILKASSVNNPDRIKTSNMEILVTVGEEIAMPAADLQFRLESAPEEVTEILIPATHTFGTYITCKSSSLPKTFTIDVTFIGRNEAFIWTNSGAFSAGFEITGNTEVGPKDINIRALAETSSVMVLKLHDKNDVMYFRELFVAVKGVTQGN